MKSLKFLKTVLSLTIAILDVVMAVIILKKLKEDDEIVNSAPESDA